MAAEGTQMFVAGGWRCAMRHLGHQASLEELAEAEGSVINELCEIMGPPLSIQYLRTREEDAQDEI